MAVELFLYLDMREQDAAVAMGLSPETPVAIYATQALKKLSAAWTEGTLWRREIGAVPADVDAAA